MNKALKQKLLYLWMILFLAAICIEEAYEKIYYLKYNINFPHRYTVFWITLGALIITIIAIVITNRKNTAKNQTPFGFYYLIAFISTTLNTIVRNKADSIMRTAVDIDKAISDIITLYTVEFIAIVVIGIIFDYTDKKRRKYKTDE